LDPSPAISSDLLATFNLYEQYAAATYCPGNNNKNIKLNCSCGNCPLVQKTNAVTVLGFINELSTDVTGYVATDPVNKLIVVAFRGSVTVSNFITDIVFPLIPIDICANCRGATGFWISWTEARRKVLSAVKTVAAANPSYKIVSAGHSLGGAIAAYAAAELRNYGYIVDLVHAIPTFVSAISHVPNTKSRLHSANLASATYQHRNTSPVKLPQKVTTTVSRTPMIPCLACRWR
jgi:hypothetical protein